MKSKVRFRKTKIVLTVIYLLFAVAYGLFLFSNFQAKRTGSEATFFGSALYEVDGGAGTGAFARPQQAYKVNDQIVCKTEDSYIVGRINEVASSNGVEIATVNAKGTNYHVPLTAVKGTVSAQVPLLGSINRFLKSAYGVVLLVVIPCLLFLIHQMVLLSRTLKEKKEREREEDDDPAPDYAPFSRLPSMTPSRGELTDRFATLTKVAKEPPRDASSIYKPAEPSAKAEQPVAAAVSAREEDVFSDLMSEMKYKMAFQDTQQLSPKREHPVDETGGSGDLKKYGLQTELIDEGIEVNIDSSMTKEIKLRLKNDGSLSIITDNYQAEINADL